MGLFAPQVTLLSPHPLVCVSGTFLYVNLLPFMSLLGFVVVFHQLSSLAHAGNTDIPVYP